MTAYPAGSPSLLRAINARAVLQLFAAGQALTRADVAAASGLSKPTVAVALAHLVERGLLAEAGQVSGRKGPAAQAYRLSPDAFLAVGVDVGRLHLRLGVVDARGGTRLRLSVPTPGSIEEIAAALDGLTGRAAAAIGVGRRSFLRTVVGVPGVIDPRGGPLRYAGGLPAGGDGLPAALRRVFGGDVVLENDVNLSAIVEGRSGAARDVDDFVLIGLGSGVGMGVVLNGRLHRGATGAAGEIGFMPSPGEAAAAVPRPPPWRARIDDVLGAGRIMDQAAAHGLAEAADPPQVFDLARDGDPRALAVVDDTARTLAWVIAAIVPVLDPQLVVLGGAVGGNGDLLTGPVRRHLRDVSPFTPDVVCSGLGSRSVLLGALGVAGDLARDVAFTLATGSDRRIHPRQEGAP